MCEYNTKERYKMGKNEVDDIERWLLDPNTTLEDIDRIANSED